MGQKRRAMFSRTARLAHLLYPDASLVPRSTWADPIGILSTLYVMSIVFGGWYLVVPTTLLRPDYRPWSLATFATAILFHTVLFLIIYCYVLAAIIDPGAVPETWRALQRPIVDDDAADSGDDVSDAISDAVSASVTLLSDARKRDSVAPAKTESVPPPAVEASLRPGDTVRFCRHCRVFKPPRAHHCGTCRRCVLLFDHHCFFMRSNCIGFYNRKFFILFVAYASLGCGMVAVISPIGVLAYINDVGESTAVPVITKLVLLLLAYMMCFLHAIVLAGFGAYHAYLACRNLTTLEHSDICEEDSTAYDRGVGQNWRATFGNCVWLWFVPVGMYRVGDGIRWRSIADVV